jgi:DNA-binding transcriptional regulator YiaG
MTTTLLTLTPMPRIDRARAERLASEAVRAARGAESQERFAERLGVAPRSVRAWELGEKRVPGWVLIGIQERRAA